MEDLGMREGFDVGLEMSGSPRALNDMLKVMIHGGKVALLGIPPGEAVVDWTQVVFKGLTLKGIYGPGDVRDLYREGFEIMSSGQSGKIVLDWKLRLSYNPARSSGPLAAAAMPSIRQTTLTTRNTIDKPTRNSDRLVLLRERRLRGLKRISPAEASASAPLVAPARKMGMAPGSRLR